MDKWAEHRMVEITEAEQNKQKNTNKKLDSLRKPLGQCWAPQHSDHMCPRRTEEERAWGNIWGDHRWKVS